MHKQDLINTKWDVSNWTTHQKSILLGACEEYGFKVHPITRGNIARVNLIYVNDENVTHGLAGLSQTCRRTQKVYADLLQISSKKHTAQQLAKARFEEAVKQTGGGSCNYYKVEVKHPTTQPKPYIVECNDLIESLDLTFAEANIYKELFRTANERTHNNGKQGNTPTRAAEKVLFFALRNAIHNGVNVETFLSELNLK